MRTARTDFEAQARTPTITAAVVWRKKWDPYDAAFAH